MKAVIRVFNGIDELSRYFGENLVAQTGIITAGSYFSLALSGGSTPKKVFDYLATNFMEKIKWERVLIFWGDERCVGPDSIESNYRMARESLLSHVPIPENQIFRIRGEENPESEADHYAEIVRRYVPSYNNMPQFNMILLGLGEDGHIASVFPEKIELFHSDRIFIASENPYTGQKRVTITGKVINNANNVVFLVTGKSKARIVSGIIEKKDNWTDFPASLVSPENGELYWLMDKPAATNLTWQTL